MFFRIGNDRFKMSDVRRYSRDGRSVSTGKWYVTIRFGSADRKFAFNTEQEMDDVVNYLDSVFKVTVI